MGYSGPLTANAIRRALKAGLTLSPEGVFVSFGRELREAPSIEKYLDIVEKLFNAKDRETKFQARLAISSSLARFVELGPSIDEVNRLIQIVRRAPALHRRVLEIAIPVLQVRGLPVGELFFPPPAARPAAFTAFLRRRGVRISRCAQLLFAQGG